MNPINNNDAFGTPFMDAFDIKSLVNNNTLAEPEKINAASQQFEAIFIKQFVENGMKSVFGEDQKSKNVLGSRSNAYNETFLPEIIAQRLASENIFGLNDTLSSSF